MRNALVAIAIVAAAACGDDGSNPQGPDAPDPDADPSCARWTVEPAVPMNLRLYDPAQAIATRTVRIAFDVALTECETIGMAFVTLPGIGEFEITPYQLRQGGGTCTGTAVTLTRVVDFQLQDSGPTTITVNGAASPLAINAAPAPAPACDVARTPCLADCDCAADERCIGVMQGGSPTTTCARPCELDRDCGGNGKCTRDAPGATPFTCDTQPECDITPESCPDGYTCMAAACVPIFTIPTDDVECSCDADCAPGLHCVAPDDNTQSPRCQALCPTDGPWCTPGWACFNEARPSVCNFVGE
jgi:hypothetical protein